MEPVLSLLTPAGLLGLVFLMVMRGWLVPKASVDEIRQERDDWRNVAHAALEQNKQLVLGARVVAQALEELPRKEEARP